MFLRVARWVPANAIVFAILVVISSVLTGGSPGRHASDAKWVSYYADAGHRHREAASLLLIGFAGLCFLSFLGSLRGLLARAEGEPARLTTAAVAAGAAFIALALAGHAVGTSIAMARSFYGTRYTVDPQTARVVAVAAFSLFVLAMFAAAAMVLATTVLAFSSRVLPSWLAWLGVVATICGVLSIFAIPAVVVLLWIVALGVWMLRPGIAVPAAALPPGPPTTT